MQTMYRQFVKFALVGASNTVIDFLIYASLTRLTMFWFNHKISATTLAFLVATVNSYILNKYWTFRNTSSKHHIQMAKFIIVGCIGLSINAGMFWILLPFGFYDLIIKVLAIGVVLVWNFFANKFWTFAE